MTNDREHINRKTQLGKNPSSPGSSINAEQTAAWAVAASSHPELHKSSQARIAPLTLTQERRKGREEEEEEGKEEGEGEEEGGREEGKGRRRRVGRLRVEGKRRKTRNAFLFLPLGLMLLLLRGVDEETKLHCFY